MMKKIFEYIGRSGNGLLQGQNRFRVLLLAVVALLVIAVAGRFLMGVYDGYARNIQNEIDIKMTRYSNLSRLMADADKYSEEHSSLVRFRSEFLDSGLIQASTPALAEAQLQNMINELADQSNLNVLSLRMLPRTQQGDITNLKIGINCRGEIGAIKEFLRRTARHEKFLFVDQIQIQILNQREKRHFNFNTQIVAWTRS
jgi:Tfp pilus assembly protein PilO